MLSKSIDTAVGLAECFSLVQKGVLLVLMQSGYFKGVGDNGMISCICLQDCRRLLLRDIIIVNGGGILTTLNFCAPNFCIKLCSNDINIYFEISCYNKISAAHATATYNTALT